MRKVRMEDDYDPIYGEDVSIEDAIEELRGNVGRGPCIYCGGKNTMTYEGDICFICSKCNMGVHEDIYYRWLAGETIEFED